jgi:hypothetical protein
MGDPRPRLGGRPPAARRSGHVGPPGASDPLPGVSKPAVDLPSDGVTPYGTSRVEIRDPTKARVDRLREQLYFLGEPAVNELLHVHGSADHVEFHANGSGAAVTADQVVSVALALLEHNLRGRSGKA